MENNRPLGWTTLEEAKLLVEACLDPNTADMSYNFVVCKVVNCNASEDWLLQPYPPDENQPHKQLPCWSLGALKKVVPDCIIKGDVYFNFHSIYSQATYYRATYEDVCFNKRIDLGCHKTEIALFVEIICWLIRNGYIKKSE